jgi:hypothetical protein
VEKREWRTLKVRVLFFVLDGRGQNALWLALFSTTILVLYSILFPPSTPTEFQLSK